MSATVTAGSGVTWKAEDVRVAGSKLHVRTAGSGDPVLVLHHDIGTLETLPFYEALARRHTVYLPSHPGYDRSERPEWMRSVRDIAVVYQWLLAERRLAGVSVVGLGFGGWIAAEMATMSPAAFRRLVLVGAMGIKPTRGEILDQALVSYIDYARAGFEDQAVFARLYGADPTTAQLEQWDLNREMTFRIAWKPYCTARRCRISSAACRRRRSWSGDDGTGSCRSSAASSTPRPCPARASPSSRGPATSSRWSSPTRS